MTEKADKMGQKRTNPAKSGRKLDDFVLALMTHGTLEETAEALGIDPRTVRRWLKESGVRRRLHEIRQDAMDRAMTQLQAAATEAVLCLRQVMASGDSESAKVAASRVILEQALRAVEINDVQTRLDVLEEIARTRDWGGPTNDQPTTPIAGNRTANGHG